MRVDIIEELNKSVNVKVKGETVYPKILDIHPVNGRCNLNCVWCIGQAGYEGHPPLEDRFSEVNLQKTIENVFNPVHQKDWPLEIHICGCDSEPLLKSRQVCWLINELKKRNRTVELITNGLLISKKNINDLIKLDKISISLDVINDEDFFKYKVNRKVGNKFGFTKVLENIHLILEEKKKTGSKVSIYVTFVTTPETFKDNLWKESFELLKDAGVNHIQVRTDINDSLGKVNDLETRINNISKELAANSIDYDSLDHFDIKYHSPLANEKSFDKCVSPYFWPALGMDLKMYRCAHTTLSIYEHFLDTLGEDYYEYYQNNRENIKSNLCIGCKKKCPPTLSRLNSKMVQIQGVK